MGFTSSPHHIGGMTLVIESIRNLGRRVAVRCGIARVVRRFRTDESGATAVEFSLVAIPFFAFLFAIFETALVLFAQQLLEEATATAARLVRTGQAQAAGLTAETFKAKICGQVSLLLDCSKLIVDIKVISAFGPSNIDLTVPVDANGNLDTAATPSYAAGNGGSIVLVRSFYQWPITINQAANIKFNLANMHGTHLLMATAAFRNEPFPW